MKKSSRARRHEHKQKRRDDILDAAERAIRKYGLEKVNFGHIAKLTKLSRPLIYVYFPTRDELICAVSERALIELRRRFEAVVAQHPEGLEQVVALGRAYQQFSEECPLYLQLISEMESKDIHTGEMTDAKEGCAAAGKFVLGIVVHAVQHGIEDGSMARHTGDPRLTAMSIWAFTHGLIQVAEKKSYLLENEFQLTSAQLFEHGIAVLRKALARSAGHKT